MAIIHIVFTIVLFAVFIGIVIWAYSSRRRQDFAQAEQLPFLDEEPSHNDQPGGPQ